MKDVRKYCIAEFMSALIVSLLIVLSAVLFVVTSSKYCNEDEKIILYFLGVFFCGVAVYVFIRLHMVSNLKFEKRLKEYADEISPDIIGSDFDSSTSFFNDNVRAGRYFIYSRYTGNFLPLGDIMSIDIHRRQVEMDTSWQVNVTTIKEKLVFHTLKKCSTADWESFVEYINTVAPNINVGEMTFYVQKREYIPPLVRGFPITRN